MVPNDRPPFNPHKQQLSLSCLSLLINQTVNSLCSHPLQILFPLPKSYSLFQPNPISMSFLMFIVMDIRSPQVSLYAHRYLWEDVASSC